MPELPEVEVLVRHLSPALVGRRVDDLRVHRPRVTRPTGPAELRAALRGTRCSECRRRGKYLVFRFRRQAEGGEVVVLGHLGMTGRMYVIPQLRVLPKHVAVDMRLDVGRFVFEDTRFFGRFTLDLSPLDQLGPEPLESGFNVRQFAEALRRSAQPIKVKLLDQQLVAGLGNIYASEALFRARISPLRGARSLTAAEIRRLHRAIKAVLSVAIKWGSTVPLDWPGAGERDRLFYYGRERGAPGAYEERLQVYDRLGETCRRCRQPIRRIWQGGRSTFYCPRCQQTGS